MGLPRHLRDKYSATDGAPIANAATGTAGTQATSTPATQQQGTTSGAQGAAHTDPHAATPTAAATTGTQPDGSTGQDGGAASSQLLNPTGEGGAEGGAGSGGDDNFRRMEGRYKAEVTRLKGLLATAEEGARGASQLTDLLMETRQELSNTRQQLTQVQGGGEAGARGTPTGGQGGAASEPALPELSDEEQAMYGDFAPVAEKLIARATAPLLKQIAELQTANGTSSDAVGQLNENLFVRDVRSRVPEMEAITQSPAWKEYLQRNIPLTRLRIQDALVNAHNERDLAGVVSIFDTFKTEQGSQQQPTDTGTTAAAAAGGAAAASSSADAGGLAQFATPDRTASNGTGRPSAKFKESDYRARVDSMRTGRITKAEFMQFDKEFQEARSRGLVSKD
ncbi:hypothetical protein G3O06_07715 [Burkholderia sp. Ac-20345]|uniref:hypothetical protein n=1 Tax=Burkholderia sp. Ac-20345 TaxID=2703891 RepID=UPI00197B2F16|nr:hypothetical protein [Burkholderia sp. Ac-20345]MBN3777437.1 hypothetical protein [Burkholderia sp. Ac-20345]